MARYLVQFSYAPESVKGMVAKPQDRRKAADAIIRSSGGKLIDIYFCFGDYDGVALAEFPSNVDGAAASLALGASGAFTKLKTTVLLTMDEAVDAMKKANKIAGEYKPPSA